jgi:hypothetical protein
MKIMDSYPKELYIELANYSPELLARVIIYKEENTDANFHADIDIIQSLNSKIYKHIDQLFNYSDERELIDTCVDLIRQKVSK